MQNEANIVQINNFWDSYMVIDPLGDIMRQTYSHFKNEGYKIKVLNFTNLKQTMKYNPLLYIFNGEKNIQSFSEIIVSENDFVARIEKMLLNILLGWFLKEGNEEELSLVFLAKNLYKILSEEENISKIFESEDVNQYHYDLFSLLKNIKNQESYEIAKASLATRLSDFLAFEKMIDLDTVYLNELYEDKAILFVITDKYQHKNPLIFDILQYQILNATPVTDLYSDIKICKMSSEMFMPRKLVSTDLDVIFEDLQI